MNPRHIKFLTEKYEKEIKSSRFREDFIAIPRLKIISGKFYAKHDVMSLNNVPEEFLNLVKRYASSTPKDSFNFPPPSVNMDYGWFSDPLIPRSSDNRLMFPLKQCDYIRNEIYIRAMEQKVPQDKFTGVPFRF